MTGHTDPVLRLILGLVKGLVLGGALGYGAYVIGIGGALNWLFYALLGALIGLFVGRPVWRHAINKESTVWTSVLKALFGAAIAVGLYAVVAKVWGGFDIELLGETRNVTQWPFIVGGAIGGLYGAFVEFDDVSPQSK